MLTTATTITRDDLARVWEVSYIYMVKEVSAHKWQCQLCAMMLLRKFFHATNACWSATSLVLAVEEQISQSPCPSGTKNLEEKVTSKHAII